MWFEPGLNQTDSVMEFGFIQHYTKVTVSCSTVNVDMNSPNVYIRRSKCLPLSHKIIHAHFCTFLMRSSGSAKAKRPFTLQACRRVCALYYAPDSV